MRGYSQVKSDPSEIGMLRSSISHSSQSFDLSYWISRSLGYVSLIGVVTIGAITIFT